MPGTNLLGLCAGPVEGELKFSRVRITARVEGFSTLTVPAGDPHPPFTYDVNIDGSFTKIYHRVKLPLPAMEVGGEREFILMGTCCCSGSWVMGKKPASGGGWDFGPGFFDIPTTAAWNNTYSDTGFPPYSESGVTDLPISCEFYVNTESPNDISKSPYCRKINGVPLPTAGTYCRATVKIHGWRGLFDSTPHGGLIQRIQSSQTGLSPGYVTVEDGDPYISGPDGSIYRMDVCQLVGTPFLENQQSYHYSFRAKYDLNDYDGGSGAVGSSEIFFDVSVSYEGAGGPLGSGVKGNPTGGGLGIGSLQTGDLQTGGLGTGGLVTGGLVNGDLRSGGLGMGSLYSGGLGMGNIYTGVIASGSLNGGGLQGGSGLGSGAVQPSDLTNW